MRKFQVLFTFVFALLVVGLGPSPPTYPRPAESVYSTPTAPTPTAHPTPADSLQSQTAEAMPWHGQYFNNRSLEGGPAVERTDDCIDFNWGTGPPAAGMRADNFSARWTKQQDFEHGFYRFYLLTDDGARFWIDPQVNDYPIIGDAWKDQPPTVYTRDIELQQGTNSLLVEYYEHAGTAQIKFWWEKLGEYEGWKAEYFKFFRPGGPCGGPVLTRAENAIDHDWDTGSPSADLGPDHWAARWTGNPRFVGGLTRFFTRSDDGVRLWVDANDNGSFEDSGELIIDKWIDQSATVWSGDIYVRPGVHQVKLEYYEQTGEALVKLWWRNW